MFRPIAWTAAAVVLMAAPAAAQEWSDRRLNAKTQGGVVAKIVPGSDYQLVVGASQLQPERGMPKRAFVAAVAGWVAVETGLPLPAALPRIALLTPRTMQELRYRQVDAVPTLHESAIERPEVIAIYDDAEQTIYLARGWTGRTPAEVSVLVHEMVHHLQSLAEQKFACLGEREKAAYTAQERWLGMFGHSLDRDFDWIE